MLSRSAPLADAAATEMGGASAFPEVSAAAEAVAQKMGQAAAKLAAIDPSLPDGVPTCLNYIHMIRECVVALRELRDFKHQRMS